jgi:YD repeat-containing protein
LHPYGEKAAGSFSRGALSRDVPRLLNELIGGTLTPYSYGYDALNRLTTVTSPSTTESYAYDPLGNRRTKTSGATTLAYFYDEANQLREIHTGSAA